MCVCVLPSCVNVADVLYNAGVQVNSPFLDKPCRISGSLLYHISVILVPDFIMFCTNFNDAFLSYEIIIFIEKIPRGTDRWLKSMAVAYRHLGGRMQVVRQCFLD